MPESPERDPLPQATIQPACCCEALAPVGGPTNVTPGDDARVRVVVKWGSAKAPQRLRRSVAGVPCGKSKAPQMVAIHSRRSTRLRVFTRQRRQDRSPSTFQNSGATPSTTRSIRFRSPAVALAEKSFAMASWARLNTSSESSFALRR